MPSVVVVDDDPELRALLRQLLQQDGFDVWAEGDGEAGLRAVRALQPDVVVLDWLLPGLSGVEVCRSLRADPGLRATRVLMVTSRGEEPDREWAYAAGVDDYVAKPFAGSDVMARVRRLATRPVPPA